MAESEQGGVAAGCAAVRAPRQARGQRRVDGILDAAESLMAEVGVAEASVQEIARRAGASVGSMYHFFPTKDAIVAAVAERHERQLRDVCDCIARAAEERADRPLGEFVDGLVTPFVDFIAASPAYLVLARVDGIPVGRVSPGSRDALGADFHRTLVVALGRRFGGVGGAEWAFRAGVIQAMGEGVLARAARVTADERERYFCEFRRALAAYLSTYETAAAPALGA